MIYLICYPTMEENIPDTQVIIWKAGHHNPEEMTVNMRIREILKILMESVWLKSSTFALLCLIKAAAYLRGPLNVRTEQWWNDSGQGRRKICHFFHYQEHMKSLGTEPRFLWYETRVLNDPHQRFFKEIPPPPQKKKNRGTE